MQHRLKHLVPLCISCLLYSRDPYASISDVPFDTGIRTLCQTRLDKRGTNYLRTRGTLVIAQIPDRMELGHFYEMDCYKPGESRKKLFVEDSKFSTGLQNPY